jgi:hypothetical protein
VGRKTISGGSFNWTMKEIFYIETMIRSIEPIKPKILKKWPDLDLAISDRNGGAHWTEVSFSSQMDSTTNVSKKVQWFGVIMMHNDSTAAYKTSDRWGSLHAKKAMGIMFEEAPQCQADKKAKKVSVMYIFLNDNTDIVRDNF